MISSLSGTSAVFNSGSSNQSEIKSLEKKLTQIQNRISDETKSNVNSESKQKAIEMMQAQAQKIKQQIAKLESEQNDIKSLKSRNQQAIKQQAVKQQTDNDESTSELTAEEMATSLSKYIVNVLV